MNSLELMRQVFERIQKKKKFDIKISHMIVDGYMAETSS